MTPNSCACFTAFTKSVPAPRKAATFARLARACSRKAEKSAVSGKG
jgi:cob(I)alamin adenosyltransferase